MVLGAPGPSTEPRCVYGSGRNQACDGVVYRASRYTLWPKRLEALHRTHVSILASSRRTRRPHALLCLNAVLHWSREPIAELSVRGLTWWGAWWPFSWFARLWSCWVVSGQEPGWRRSGCGCGRECDWSKHDSWTEGSWLKLPGHVKHLSGQRTESMKDEEKNTTVCWLEPISQT